VKAIDSYIGKINKEKDGKIKYNTPIKEIQDLIGARVVVYYKQTADEIFDYLSKYFTVVERTRVIPDEPSKFGYEGLHLICLISPIIFNKYKADKLLPDFFELQIKTLYQHAWGQAEHGLGYKPDVKLEIDEKRKLAFIAAQSWGADEILSDLYNSKLK
jgi:ppGpp synthetase/RelA/SpoT-type nucleotidyltranferase